MLKFMKLHVSFWMALLPLPLALFSMGHIWIYHTLTYPLAPMPTVLQFHSVHHFRLTPYSMLCSSLELLGITYQQWQVYLHSPLPQLTFLATTNFLHWSREQHVYHLFIMEHTSIGRLHWLIPLSKTQKEECTWESCWHFYFICKRFYEIAALAGW